MMIEIYIGVILLSSLITCIHSENGLQFEEWPKWKVLAPGDETELRCKTNLASDRLVWIYDHHTILHNSDDTQNERNPLQHQQLYFFNNSENQMTSILHVRLHHREEQYQKQLGIYQCVAWLGSIAVTSLPGRIEIATLDEFSGPSGNQNLTTVEGEPARIYCPLPHSNPPAELAFYKDGQLLDTSSKEDYWHSQSGDLVLRKVSKSQEGTYVCTAYNTVLRRPVTSAHYTDLHVIKNKQYKANKEVISYQDRYIFKTGEKAELTCLVSGYNQSEVIWKRHNGNIPKEVEFLQDGSLVIPQVSIIDNGQYSCGIAQKNNIFKTLETTSLIVQEPPYVSIDSVSDPVKEGTNISIECKSKGYPSPVIIWVFNGILPNNDDNVIINGTRLSINNIEKRHAGVYQCFAYNLLGTAEGNIMIQVIPKKVIKQYFDNSNRKNSYSDGNNRKDIMVAPPRPEITKISDDSVLVSWNIKNRIGMPVLFYKVQYREMYKNARNRSSKWRTVDEEVPPYINSLEVIGLQTGNVYRFRLAAVYANHDNRPGPTSKRFLLEKDIKLKKPDKPPVIENLIELTPSNVMLIWSYNNNITTEGFIIQYRESTSARDYVKLTALGDSRRTYNISNLHPNISYDFKLQSFNMAGTSKSSNIVSRWMKDINSSDVENEYPETTLYPVVLSESSVVSNFYLYIILGVVISLLITIVAVSFFVYSCRNRSFENHNSRRYSPCVLTDEQFEISHPLKINGIHINGQILESYEGTVITSIS